MMNSQRHVSTTLSPSFDPTVYNTLPSVIPADEALSEKGDSELFFNRAANLVCRFGLEAYVGVCLLHNHNSVGTDELMVESLESLGDGRPALVMALTKTREAGESVPAVWKLQEAAGQQLFVPLEYSTQEQARDGYQRLLENHLFLTEFSALLLEFDYQNIIGLTVLRSDALRRGPGDHLVERAYRGRIANIVTAEQRTEESRQNLVTTNWHFVKKMAEDETECTVWGECERSCHNKWDEDLQKFHHHEGHEAPCISERETIVT
jgi:hypothetical protein